ncbi:hypothetical protein B0H14DRAFT_2647406 [Mycena olivaceomarginata]|nr:hypothetical protein B0H14DRAFT_2647406 [Mycena olivaceomarginata]
MLKLPAPSSAPASLSQSSRDLLEFAQRSGYDGTSDATAVTFPETFSNRECEVFLEFIFNLLPCAHLDLYEKRKPYKLSVGQRRHRLWIGYSGVEYAIHHLKDHPELGAALWYRLASNYGIDRWAKRAYYELMSGSMLEVTSEDELLLCWDAYRSLVRAHDEVTQCWVDNWMGMFGGVGNLLKDGLTGLEMHDALGDMDVSGMTGECRLLTITSIQDTPGK